MVIVCLGVVPLGRLLRDDIAVAFIFALIGLLVHDDLVVLSLRLVSIQSADVEGLIFTVVRALRAIVVTVVVTLGAIERLVNSVLVEVHWLDVVLFVELVVQSAVIFPCSFPSITTVSVVLHIAALGELVRVLLVFSARLVVLLFVLLDMSWLLVLVSCLLLVSVAPSLDIERLVRERLTVLSLLRLVVKGLVHGVLVEVLWLDVVLVVELVVQGTVGVVVSVILNVMLSFVMFIIGRV